MTRRTTRGAIALGVVVAGAIAAWFVVPRPPIRIACITPLTGPEAHWGTWTRQGIDLAVEQVNARGGVWGRRLVVQYEDSGGRPDAALAAARKLIEIDKIQFLLGPATSAEVLAVAPLAQQHQVPLITGTASSRKIAALGNFIFRIYTTSAHEASYLVSAARRLKLLQPAILFIDNAYGADTQRELAKRLRAAGAAIKLTEGYDPAAQDFRPLLDAVKSLEPDAIFLVGYPADMARILRQAREIDLRATLLASATFDAPVVVDLAGEAAEGVIFVYPEIPESEASTQFRAAFQRKYTTAPTIYSALGYDELRILAQAIQHGGRRTEDVRHALHTVAGFPGATGSITFGGTDVNERPLALRMIRGGREVPFGALTRTGASADSAPQGTSPGAILRSPARFDGGDVLLAGRVTNLRPARGPSGGGSYTFDLAGGDGAIHVRSTGLPSCPAGGQALIEGRFDRVLRIESEIVHNQVTATHVICE